MRIVFAAFAGAAVTAIGLRIDRRVLGERHIKTNFRGNEIVATGGISMMTAVPLGFAIGGIGSSGAKTGIVMMVTSYAFAILGLIDDLYGDRHAGGLVGHARALLRGEVTTGLMKAVGGALTGLVAAWALGWRGVWIVLAGAVIALAANLVNLFDLRPGRVAKVWLPVVVVLALVMDATAPRAVLAGAAGAAVVFLVCELREQVMLGDVGAGLLGGLLGVALAASVGRMGLVVALVVLGALTLASELVSFTKVIEAVPPLRWYDRLGRKP